MQQPEKPPLIIAHRGASAHAPENTFAAFQRAIDDGAEGIEFDVRFAKDGVAVVFHDPTLNRTGRIEGRVSQLTSAELGNIDVGSWFNQTSPKRADAKFSSEIIPTLADTLYFLRRYRGLVLIEIKCRDSEIEALSKAVCRAVVKSRLASQIIVKSFKLGVIPQIRRYCPGIKTAALFAPKIVTMLRKEKHLVKIAEEFGADELSIHYSLATRKLVEKAEKRNLSVTIWTADHPRWIKRGIRLGLKAIITNDPARLLAKRKELLTAG